MDWFKRKSKPETMVFTIKYRGFLKIFPSSNSMTYDITILSDVKPSDDPSGNKDAKCRRSPWTQNG
jgi:hypothetical protein